jgi:hypothetical protein
MNYRGIEIKQETRYISSTSHGFYWVACIDGRVLRSLTQAGIKAQIGRMLNGLPPADCNNCIHMHQESMITVKCCKYYRKDCDPGVNFECEAYQVRK